MSLMKSSIASKALKKPFLATTTSSPSSSFSSSSSSSSLPSSSGRDPQASSTLTRIAIVMLLYCVSGTALTLVNKVAMTTFPFPSIVLVLQNVATVLMLCVGTAASPEIFGHAPPLSRQTLTLWAPLAVAFVVMLISSMLALLEVSAVIVIRNLTSITVAALEYAFLGTRVPVQGAVALLGMLAGAVMFSLHDLTFSLRGYLWLMANLVATSSYQVAVKGIISSKTSQEIGPFGFAYLNNVLSLPLIVALSVATRTRQKASVELPALDSPTVVILALSCALGFFLSVTGFILNTMISATSLMVANNANKFMVVVLSEIFIQRTLDMGATVGVALVLLFGGLYARSRQKKGK